MKKEQREPYRFLANFPREGWGLCNWCKFAEWSGGTCCDADLTCKHPLPVISEGDGLFYGEDHAAQVWGEGADCWGFRPAASLQEMGIVASIRASGNMARKNKHGEWVAVIPSERGVMEKSSSNLREG